MQTLADLLAILVAFLLTAVLFVHYRGRVRLKFLRQVTDHSTFTAPYNALVYLFSKVPTRPFLPADDFPDLAPLNEAWATVREEGLRLAREEKVRTATADNDVGFHTFFKRGWTRFYLRWYGTTPPSALRECPKTVEILNQVPSVKGAMFALLPPRAKLGKHRDPFAGSLRYHLGLATPNSPDCWIEVDGLRASWRDGEAMIFDETYVHEVKNDTDEHRLILLCDVERPLRGPMARVNRWMMDRVMGATTTQNEEGEKVGAINRAFGPLYRLSGYGKRLKAKDRRLYYTLKYTILAVLAVAVVAAIAGPYVTL
ncbi:MAG TPA: aspartyl/asparaginyl beta-hydroxylase domain-containing protein [Caulobacteraceae bacterium]|jgi:beta-hydroxylase|nr:aspartyl/asparaginyl beta-hydroxylase domain-containing protein [Caulobacteraceae bacterium]